MRKRKRSTSLNKSSDVESKKFKEADDDVGKSEIEVKDKEEMKTKIQDEEETQVDSLEGQCSLCTENLEAGHEDIETAIGSSDSSYATILNAVFNSNSSEQTNPRLSFSSGKICLPCKVDIRELDQLQNRVICLKEDILSRASRKPKGISVEQREQTSNPDSDDTEEDFDEHVTKAEEKKRPVSVKLFDDDKSNSVSSYKSGRPKREKPENSMSEIEKAKIKNLQSDIKFSVKKRNESDVFIIEYLKEKKGSKYLVKWENRHESENSWESEHQIPASVLQVDFGIH